MTAALRLVPDTGPTADDVLVDRPGQGERPGPVRRWDAGPDEDGELVAELPFDAVIRPGQRLRWAVFPRFDESHGVEEAYRAAALAVDLVTDDERRLSATGARDQHGVALDPAAQDASRTVAAAQWTVKTVDLDALAGAHVLRAEVRVLARPGRTLTGWLSSLAVEDVPPPPVDAVDAVRTTRGSRSSFRFSRGNTAPLVAVPHGGVFGTPVTDAAESRWIYRYSADDREDGRPALQAFATSHVPSPWMGDRGVFQVMPTADPGGPLDGPSRALGFDHEEEVDRPHRYAVRLDGGIGAEMTAGRWSVLLRFAFPPDSPAALVLDQVDEHGGIEPPQPGGPGVARAFVDGAGDDPRMFVHAEIDAPVLAVRRDGPVRAAITVDPGPDGVVEVRLGTSFLGTAQAERNLRLDLDDGGFADVQERAHDAWAERLDLVEVEGATPDRRTTLASSLYRVFLYPNEAMEDVGDAERWAYASPFHALERPHTVRETGCRVVRGRLTANHGFWDTCRTVWPLLTLLRPADAGALADGFLQHFRDGGWTSRWSAPGPRDVMTGTSTDVVFADAVLADLPGLDALTAYDSALKNATVPSPDPATGRKGVRSWTFRGFTDTSVPEGMSWTLDAAICDWAIARTADALRRRLPPEHPRQDGLAADAQYYRARAARWATVFDERIGFFQGRRPDGAWRARPDRYDPAEWGGDYTETNGWGTAFTAPHDGGGLTTLFGGPAALAARFDAFLATPETASATEAGSYGGVIHEMREARDTRQGMLALSNQPAHHIPWMAAFTGEHGRTQAMVADALRRLFLGSEIGQGWPGDEDDGEMSAWWVFAALGLYPLVPASGEFVISTPLFRSASVALPDGKRLRIRTIGPEDGDHIGAVTVDGEPWDRVTVDRDRLLRGAEIVVERSTTPTSWAAGSTPSSLTAPGDRPRMRLDLTAPSLLAGPAFDDRGERAVRLAPGRSVTHRFARPVRSELCTVTLGEAGPASWRLEGRTTEGWRLLDRRDDEEFQWAGQTRPFLLADPGEITAVRLVAVSPLDLLQLELLADD